MKRRQASAIYLPFSFVKAVVKWAACHQLARIITTRFSDGTNFPFTDDYVALEVFGKRPC